MKAKTIDMKERRPGTVEESAGEKDSFYENVIHEYWSFIEKQCFKAIRLKHKKISTHGPALASVEIDVENEALELSNRTLDTLKADHYRALRQFKRNAKFTTYITAIIARQAVDLIREKRGRNREKDRARELGQLGERIYGMMVNQGFSAEEIYRNLNSANGVKISLDEILQILDRIKGKDVDNPGSLIPADSQDIKQGFVTGEQTDIEVPDKRSNPEKIFLEKEQREKITTIINQIVGRLKGEDRIILRMRFPASVHDAPMKVKSISQILGISEKAVYKRIDRILKDCRSTLVKEGLHSHELL